MKYQIFINLSYAFKKPYNVSRRMGIEIDG